MVFTNYQLTLANIYLFNQVIFGHSVHGQSCCGFSVTAALLVVLIRDGNWESNI